MQLVFHAGPLNEFMLLMPLLRAMGQPMTVVAPWQRASLASRMLGASPMDIELFEFTRLHAPGGPTRVSPAVKDLFAQSTRIVSFLSSDQDAWAQNVRALATSATMILNDPRPPATFTGHFADWHRTQLANRGLSLEPLQPTPLQNSSGPIVVHPGSSAIKRCWPADRFEEVIRSLKKLGMPITPVIGEVELERWAPDRISHWTEDLGAVVVRTSDALLPLLQQARLFIGNDAGPAHIAAQAGTRSITILGPTDPARLGQRASHVRFVRPPHGPDRIEEVSIEAVLDAVGLG